MEAELIKIHAQLALFCRFIPVNLVLFTKSDYGFDATFLGLGELCCCRLTTQHCRTKRVCITCGSEL